MTAPDLGIAAAVSLVGMEQVVDTKVCIAVQVRMLAVDDDRHIVGLLMQLFTDERFDVRSATDGLAALESIERGEADIVVSDVMIPRLNGIEFARRLQGRTTPVPLVLVSAVPQPADMPSVPSVRKPFDVDHLLRVVNELLGQAPGDSRAGDGR